MTTIYDALAERLGRKPTHQEIKDDVKRILAEAGKLSYQKKSPVTANNR